MMEKNLYRKFLARNILFTHEVATKLNVSSQRISALRREGELVPVKSTSNGSVYLLQDVLQYMERKGLLPRYENRRLPKFISRSGVTENSLAYFNDNIGLMGEIERVSIYFEDIDAAVENYFLLSEKHRYGDLTFVSTPSMVIADSNGEEMWLYGCNCSYGGEGPHGSARILKSLGIPDKIAKKVFEYPIVKYVKSDDGNWEVNARGTDFNSRSHDEYRNVHAGMYWHQGRLTLIQEDGFRKSNSIDILEKYWAFIPNPAEYILFADDSQAIDFGFFNPSSGYGRLPSAYRLIIRDYSGRQIWLNPYIEDNKSLDKQSELKDILEACGFSIEKEGLYKSLSRWFELTLNKVDPTLPAVGKRDPFWS